LSSKRRERRADNPWSESSWDDEGTYSYFLKSKVLMKNAQIAAEHTVLMHPEKKGPDV
jgi:hypothetical protein